MCGCFIAQVFPLLLVLDLFDERKILRSSIFFPWNFPFLTEKRTTTSEENKSIQPKPLRFFTDDLFWGYIVPMLMKNLCKNVFPQPVLKTRIRRSCFFYCIFLQWAFLSQVYYIYIVSQLLTKPWLSDLTAMMRHFHFWFLAYVALNIALPLCTSYPGKMSVPAM